METLKRYRLWAVVVSCCMIVLGAAMILRPDISALAVCYLTGALCIAMGVCEIARYFSIGVIGILFRFDLIVGILSTLAGVLLLAHPTGALTVLPIILGFYIIIDSVFSIQAAVELRRFGLGSWGLNLLLGIVGAVLGVLMILDPFDGAAALMIYMGVSLLLAGVESIYTVICLSRAFNSDAHQRVIDTVGNEFVKMIFVSFLNSNIYPLKNLPTSRVCISLETPYSKASSHFPIASH